MAGLIAQAPKRSIFNAHTRLLFVAAVGLLASSRSVITIGISLSQPIVDITFSRGGLLTVWWSIQGCHEHALAQALRSVIVQMRNNNWRPVTAGTCSSIVENHIVARPEEALDEAPGEEHLRTWHAAWQRLTMMQYNIVG